MRFWFVCDYCKRAFSSLSKPYEPIRCPRCGTLWCDAIEKPEEEETKDDDPGTGT